MEHLRPAAGRGLSGYRSIFLEPDWVHRAYYGWSDEWPDPQLRVLKRRNGPVERRLVISELDDFDRAASLADEARRAAGPVSETVVHDLAGAVGWARLGYAPLGRQARLLNVDTIIIDLSRSEDELLAGMSQQCRRHIRAAEKAGLDVRVEASPSADRLDGFLGRFGKMAGERGFRPPPKDKIGRMFADGRATLIGVGAEAGTNFVMTYRAGGSAIFLHGVGGRTSDGAGHLAQWQAMLALKSQGVRWYDLGGLPSLDDSDGIFRFKKGFGGELVHLGREYRFQTPIARLIRMGADGARRLNLVGSR